MNKEEKKISREKYKEAELLKFRESLPMDEHLFPPLFDFLEKELLTHECKDDLSLLQKYCDIKQLDFHSLETWFKEYGGFCDCKIVSNVAEKFDYLDKSIVHTQPKKKQAAPQPKKLQSLTTDFGFSISKIPAPWLLIASYLNDSTTYQFQIGKKTNFPLLLKTDFPIDKLSDDHFLENYWIEDVNLDYELDFVIERIETKGFKLVQVKTQRWIPVFMFVYAAHSKWCLLMKTESTKVKNDIKEIDKLLDQIGLDD